MSLIANKQTNDPSQSNPKINVSVAFAIALLSPIIYFVSIAPAFKIAANIDGLAGAKAARRLYKPLFNHVPRMTRSYLDLCGVSDLEIFLVLQPAQGESP